MSHTMNNTAVSIGPFHGTPVAEGGFARVYRSCHPNTGQPLAIKWAKPDCDPEHFTTFAHEYRVLSELVSTQLPRAFAFGWNENRPYFATDWIEGQPLWDEGTTRVDIDITLALRQIATVLDFLHQRGWVHGDLKPGNFIWGDLLSELEEVAGVSSRGSLYLVDFGLARRAGDADRPRGAGTVGYTAPEFLRRESADGRADWYSVGIILYEWIFGRRPFAADDPADEIAAHLEETPSFDLPSCCNAPEWIIELLPRLLAKEADERGGSAREIVDWIGAHDDQFDLDVSRTHQLSEHWASENRRLRGHEQHLLAQVVDESPREGNPVWTIFADRHRVEAFTRELCTYATALNAPPCNADTVEISPDEFTIRFGTATRDGSDTALTERAVTLLSWPIPDIEDYLGGILGSYREAVEMAPRFYALTSGIPTVLSDLTGYLIHQARMRIVAGEVGIDRAALTEWQQMPEAAQSFADSVGDLTPDERRMIDWFSVGRGRAQTDLLQELMQVSSDRLRTCIRSLRERGIIRNGWNSPDEFFFDWRLRHTALAPAWRAQLPERHRRRAALGLAALLESASIENDVRVYEVLAQCFADAGSHEKSVHFCTLAVSEHLKANRQEEAKPFVELAGHVAQQIPAGRAQAHWTGRARMARGDYQQACGQLEEARQTYRELLVLGRRYADRRLLAETLKDLSSLYRLTRRFKKGTRAARRALQLFKELDDQNEVARTLINLGNMYWVASDRSTARQYYDDALSIAQQLADVRLQALVLSNLGATYWGDHEFQRAESFYRRSLVLRERIEEPVETAGTLNNLGVLAMDQGRLSEADSLLRRAIDLNLSVGAEAEAVFNRGNLMQVALERGDLRTVIAEGEVAQRDADALGDVATAAEVGGLLAEAYLRAGDFRLAQHFLLEARDRARGQENNDLLAHLGLVSAMVHWRLRQRSRAEHELHEATPLLIKAAMPRMHLDAMIIRLLIAVSRGEIEESDRLWLEGRGEAMSISAPHKEAQMCLARLAEDPAAPFPEEAIQILDRFLDGNDDWFWSPDYRVWCAQQSLAQQEWQQAEEIAFAATERLRTDGNWETLWHALVVYAQACYNRSDYEPALRAFDEATLILTEIANTIDASADRQRYLEQPLARALRETRERILELVS